MPICISQGTLLTHFTQQKTPQEVNVLFPTLGPFLPSEVVMMMAERTKVTKAILCHDEIKL